MTLTELDGYTYPDEYRVLRQRDAIQQSVHPWQFIDDVDEASTVRKEFLLEVGNGSIAVRDMLPFAKHSISDDYAGFIQKNGEVTGEVCTVHLTFRHAAEISGYPRHEVFPSLERWIDNLTCDR
jgi:hypothetical protein